MKLAAVLLCLPALTACDHDYAPLEPPEAPTTALTPDSMRLTVGDSLRVTGIFHEAPVLLTLRLVSRDTSVARVRQDVGGDRPRNNAQGWVFATAPGATWVVLEVVEAPAHDDSIRVEVT